MMTVVVLTRDGCDRATAYHQANKIVRAPEGIYVTWLDAAFRCMLTHAKPDGTVGGTVPMAQGFDNHCGGTLVRTPDGVTHFLSGSHHVGFLYRSSATPMAPESWSLPECAGMLPTYPSLVYDREGLLHLAHRHSSMHKSGGAWGVGWSMKLPGKP